MAAVAHGSSIVTQDVDVCASLVRPNLDYIVNALKGMEPFFRRIGGNIPFYDDPVRLVGFKNLYLKTSAGNLDILGYLPGVGSYEQIKQTAVRGNLGTVECYILDLDTLIAAKRVAGRPKDLIHLRHLLSLKKLRDSGGSTHLFDKPPEPPQP